MLTNINQYYPVALPTKKSSVFQHGLTKLAAESKSPGPFLGLHKRSSGSEKGVSMAMGVTPVAGWFIVFIMQNTMKMDDDWG